ncbi:MAG: efflux RND transporter periplasmic adaptor subunit [Ramlibacter sp.]|nr:efflux RND transporter periplasmic adaptor subunit [Ramlibacter sp.]
MLKRPWLWIAGGVAVAAAVVAAGVVLRAPEVDTFTVQPAPLVRTLQFSARVATLSRVNVGATLTGRVARVAVDEGAQVRRGDVLVQLETAELQAAVAQARAAERQAEARLTGLRSTGRTSANAGLLQAQATVHAAEADLARTQQLVTQGFLSEARLDDARRAMEVARAQQAGAQAQASANDDNGTDVAQAQAQLAQVRAATAAAQQRLGQAAVLAPTDARVLTRSVEPGQIVQPGASLMSLALAGPMQLVAQVDERFLDQLQAGQQAMVVADAFAGQPFAAKVLSIAPAVDAQRGAIEVKLALAGAAPAFLREDMTLSVEVETGQRERALVLPLRALRDNASANAGSVLTAQDGRAHARQVRLGLRTLDAVEVLDGLRPGETVLLGGKLQDGSRVRTKAVAWKPGSGGLPAATREDAGSALTNAVAR